MDNECVMSIVSLPQFPPIHAEYLLLLLSKIVRWRMEDDSDNGRWGGGGGDVNVEQVHGGASG